MLIEKTHWYYVLHKYKKIYIFGASEGGVKTLECIKKTNVDVDVDGFLVSDEKKYENPRSLAGKKVYSFSDFTYKEKMKCLVIVPQKYEDLQFFEKLLNRAGFYHIEGSLLQYTTELGPEEINQIKYLYGKDSYCDINISDISCISSYDEKQKISIYVVTSHLNIHKVQTIDYSKYAKFIQAGAAKTNIFLAPIKDNTGDNISTQNEFYCELSAGYWIWKNDHISEWVGLYHYSRGLKLNDEIINRIVVSNYDIIVSKPMVFRHELASRLKNLDILRIAIHKFSPEYDKNFELYFLHNIFFAGNLLFARKSVFNKYYEWMFGVFKEAERLYINHCIEIKKRGWGYWGEYLLGLYLLQNKDILKFAFAEIESAEQIN